MEPLVIFVLPFFWFLFAWSLIVYFVVWPWSARFSPDTRLSGWVAPEMFRVLGLGLLVPNLAPGMPSEFAFATAAGDTLTRSWPPWRSSGCGGVGVRPGFSRGRAPGSVRLIS